MPSSSMPSSRSANQTEDELGTLASFASNAHQRARKFAAAITGSPRKTVETPATKQLNEELNEQNAAAQQGGLPSELEPFERRLVLSAQLLFDVLGDHAIDMHDALAGPEGIQEAASCSVWSAAQDEVAPLPSTIGISGGLGDQETFQHLREAHNATGWNDVQNEFGLTGRGQTVAVIDSGIAWDHEALGEGYGPGYRVVGGWDFTEENDAQPYDDGPLGFHGTHVAGIIGSDDATHPGVAPEVDLVALRVFNDNGGGQLSWVENALAWVHDNQDTFEHPITTVNLSLGTNWNSDAVPSWATLEDELAALAEDGIVVTASAGNSFASFGEPGLSYPAASPNVLPVASVDDDGLLSDFSQRHQRALAAPGGNILSTVPDHVLGADGEVNDFATASGTSMSAPYVAGASVLVRQAMEMVGMSDITVDTIGAHLRATADSIWDSATGAHYDSLNLQSAIDSLLPDDSVGDTFGSGSLLTSLSTTQDGWINSLGDQDTYTFTADASGQLDIAANSDWLDGLAWSLQTASGTELANSSTSAEAAIVAGQSYQIRVSAADSIGPFSLDLNFTQQGNGTGGGSGESSGDPASRLGSIEHALIESANGKYSFESVRDGIVSIEVSGASAGSQLLASSSSGSYADATVENGVLRLDFAAVAGETIQFVVPASPTATAEIANVLSISGQSASVIGTHGSDQIAVDFSSGASVQFEGIQYDFADGSLAHLSSSTVTSVQVDGRGGNDSLDIVGSSASDKVDLRPELTTLETREFALTSHSTEQVSFEGGGGPDRVYLYDSDTDDTLRARPRNVTLEGVGYSFAVGDVDRIFMHATGAGEDYAYLYDSDGDDRLSMRPQFASMSGDGFFNFVRGFERVYAYATAGGNDEATLYDSSGDDRFNTSGQSASIVGPGFSSFSRSFETVHAVAQSGGNDTASLYGDASVRWQRGADFVEMVDGDLSRGARGFHEINTYQAGQPHSLSYDTPASVLTPSMQTTPLEHADLLQSDGPVFVDSSSFGDATAQNAASWDQAAESTTHPQYPVTNSHDSWQLGTSNAEDQLLEEVREVQSWLKEAGNSATRWEERFQLPEEALIEDPTLQEELLHEVFRAFEED